MISVMSPLSETIRETSVIVVSTPSAPTNARPSVSVVVVAAEVVVDTVEDVVSGAVTDDVVSVVSPPHAARVVADAKISASRVLTLIDWYLTSFP
jgi:hypothetical protein